MLDKAFHEDPLINRFKISCTKACGEFNFPLHFHREVEMVYVSKGSLKISVMQKDYTLTENQLAIIGCNHLHAYISDNSTTKDQNIEYYILLFDWEFLSHIFTGEEEQRLLYPLIFNVSVSKCDDESPLSFVESFLDELSRETMEKAKANQFILLGGLHRFIGQLIRYGEFGNEAGNNLKKMKKEHQLLAKTNDYIFKEYMKGISLRDASIALGYSEYHFSRQFKRVTGITFKKYLVHYQISMAREDVIEGSIPITEIAYKHGFNSVKTFNRIFKEYFHQAPTEYRKAEKEMENSKK